MPASFGTPKNFDVNGQYIPAVGLGTFQGDEGNSRVKETVVSALQGGYRHLDTAAAYGNEKEVGLAIKEAEVKRDEIFVTTKLWEQVFLQPWGGKADSVLL